MSPREKIRNCLERARNRVHERITHYPMPIPACDADYNCLLEERARITDALDRLQTDAANGAAITDSITRIEALILASAHVEAETKREIDMALRLCRV